MDIKTLRIGDWVSDDGFPMTVVVVGDDYCYLDFEGNDGDYWEATSEYPPQGIPLTKKVLAKSGWVETGNLMVLRTDIDTAFHGLKNRLTWNPETGELVVNYGSVPVKILYIHELQHILCDCGLGEYADKIEIYG